LGHLGPGLGGNGGAINDLSGHRYSWPPARRNQLTDYSPGIIHHCGPRF
jgi:hypothetical protein